MISLTHVSKFNNPVDVLLLLNLIFYDSHIWLKTNSTILVGFVIVYET